VRGALGEVRPRDRGGNFRDSLSSGGFALEVKQRGGTLIEVNLYESEITQICDVSLRGGSAEVLPRLVNAVTEIRRENLS